MRFLVCAPPIWPTVELLYEPAILAKKTPDQGMRDRTESRLKRENLDAKARRRKEVQKWDMHHEAL